MGARNKFIAGLAWALQVGLGTLVVIIAGCGGMPLEPWHTVGLTEEFSAAQADQVQDFNGYLNLEDRLFGQLRDEVYAETGTGPEFALARYSSGSAADPAARGPDLNRSFELPAAAPLGGILLLHGLTDSPYTLLTLGRTLNQHGYWVIGLRLPGHGTAPSGLRTASWQDMASATRLAMQHLSVTMGDAQVHVVGYSTGAALALDLMLNAVEGSDLPVPASLVLISPAVGITPAAALARFKSSLGQLPGLGRLAWASVVPEFDPYKYNSFATRAGAEVHSLTRSVARRLASTTGAASPAEIPPTLVFKSAVDATVSTDALVDRLLTRLPENGSELVLFDINRSAANAMLLVSDPRAMTERLATAGELPFALRLVTNEHAETAALVARYKPAHSPEFTDTEVLDLAWPLGFISLSHIALPFSPDDPMYGAQPPEDKEALFLGDIPIRGERGLLRISSDWLLRLRYNPFYSVLESRVLDWLDAHGSADDAATGAEIAEVE